MILRIAPQAKPPLFGQDAPTHFSPAHRQLRRIPLVRLTHTPPYHAGGNEYEENSIRASGGPDAAVRNGLRGPRARPAPQPVGEGESQGMLPHTYSLSEAYDAAEVVALVTVGDWLEEELITGRTFFRTTVQKVYKGDIPMSLSWPRRAALPGPTETIPYSPMAISCCCS